jgi:hypothetical protein
VNYLNAACRILHKGTAYFNQVLERYHDERKELAKIKKGKTVGKQNTLESFCPMTSIKGTSPRMKYYN